MIARSKRPGFLDDGLELVHRTGFAGAGIAAIAAAARAPKGSFYNHFRSKEEFGVAILDRYFDAVQATLADLLERAEGTPGERLHAYFAFLRDLGRGQGYARGCLVGNLSAEAAPVSVALREALAVRLAEWTGALARTLAAGQGAGEIRRDVPAEVLARLLLDAWQGALLRAKVERAPDSLDAFLEVLLPSLLEGRSA